MKNDVEVHGVRLGFLEGSLTPDPMRLYEHTSLGNG